MKQTEIRKKMYDMVQTMVGRNLSEAEHDQIKKLMREHDKLRIDELELQNANQKAKIKSMGDELYRISQMVPKRKQTKSQQRRTTITRNTGRTFQIPKEHRHVTQY